MSLIKVSLSKFFFIFIFFILAIGCSTGSLQPSAPTESTPPTQRGVAAFYGSELSGKPPASGDIFNPTKSTAAHRSLPFGTQLCVKNVGNGRSAVVTVNDRGPFVEDRILDVSKSVAEKLGFIASGTATVEFYVISTQKNNGIANELSCS